MRLTFITSLLLLGSSQIVQGALGDGKARAEGPEEALAVPEKAPKAADSVGTTSGGSEVGTVFNGKGVPPPQELAGASVDETIAKGYWLVEFFSPYCHHCKAFAPTWQTMYEFYYTSEAGPSPEGALESPSSFTEYYNYHFAKVDCAAYSDACSAKGIGAFPTIVLFKDGEVVEKKTGAKDLKTMSKWVEETLETIRPGSRPVDGPKLPKVGAKIAPGFTAVDADKGIADKNAVDVSPSSTRTKSTLQATKLPKAAPNPAGKSVPLTAENFQRLVTTTRDPWFVKFYAPWCHHCQALAPSWQGMARDMKDKLNVGEVNCDVEKRLCKDVRVQGYPTMHFFRGGERITYEGLRGLGDLISFANKAVAAGGGIRDVTAAEFEKLEETEEVIFLYFYDHATTTEDFDALERLVLSLIGHAKLVKTSDSALYKRYKISTWPRLMVSRDGKPTYYTPFAPKDMRDFRAVLGWMQSVWQPIVPELTASNAREIMDGKLVVLGILSRERSDEFIIAKREIKNAAMEWIDKQTQAFQLEREELRFAKQLRIEEAEDRNDLKGLRAAKSIRIDPKDIERKEVVFAWVDGAFWERWIKTTYGINVKEGERVVVNDEDNRRYWDNTITGNPIVPSRTSILETLPKIVASPPKISPKHTASAVGHFFFVLRQKFSRHPVLSISFAVGILLAAALWVRGQIRRGKPTYGTTGGFFQINGEGLGLGLGGNGEKGGNGAGLLGNVSGNGGSGSGKVD